MRMLIRRDSLFNSLTGAPTSPTAAASTGTAGGSAPRPRCRRTTRRSPPAATLRPGSWAAGTRTRGPASPHFEAGVRATQRDVITLIRAAGNVVTARFTAVQTDGTVQYFAGTYVVQGGEIVRFLVNRVG